MDDGMRTIRRWQQGARDDDRGGLGRGGRSRGGHGCNVEKTGCCGDATMDSAIIVVIENDGLWDVDNTY